jgi:hypothetical protein
VHGRCVPLNLFDYSLRAVHQSNAAASSEVVVELLQRCQRVAESLVSRERDSTTICETASASRGSECCEDCGLPLFFAAVCFSSPQSSQHSDPRLADAVSQIVVELMKDEKVFISPEDRVALAL